MTKVLKVLLLSMLVVVPIVFDGCGIRRTGSFVVVDGGEWRADEEFELKCDSGSADDRVVVALRYNDLYPYRGLTMGVVVEDSAGRKGETILTMELYDKKGKRLGRGIGSSYLIEKATGLKFPKDSCTVKVSHLMNDSIIEGVEMIGILSVND